MAWIETVRALAATAVFATSIAVGADTVYKTNGVALDGVVTKREDGNYLVTAGTRKVIVRANEVVKIEQNDKTGAYDRQKVLEEAQTYLDKMEEETGLTAGQRSQVRDIMVAFHSEDEVKIVAARNQLVALNREIDVARYVHYILPSLSPRLAPGALEVLFYLDKSQVRGLLVESSTNVSGEVRGTALQLLGALGDRANLELVARGLVDHVLDVRYRAADGLGALRDPRATPALIEAFATNAILVRSACKVALRDTWSSEGNLVDFETAEEWANYWNEHKAQVEQPLALSSLEPLVEAGAEFHDE